MITAAGIGCGTQTTKAVIWSADGQGFRFGAILQNHGDTVESVAVRALAQVPELSYTPSDVRFIVATGSIGPKLRLANSQALEP